MLSFKKKIFEYTCNERGLRSLYMSQPSFQKRVTYIWSQNKSVDSGDTLNFLAKQIWQRSSVMSYKEEKLQNQ